MTAETKPLLIGMLAFPRMTQLDFTGPFEVFARMPGAVVHTLWKEAVPVTTDRGLQLIANMTLAACPPLDIVFVPGGPGQQALMDDAEVLAFLRRQAAGARYVTSVCTGALVLGAAGLLRGRQATTHWSAVPHLGVFGANAVPHRVVFDGQLVTGGGVTAGIDFGLSLAGEIFGDAVAKEIQLQIEYDPAPPYDAGHPSKAEPDALERVRERGKALFDARRKAAIEAAERLKVEGLLT
jgi:cyclohexyl-isocyanide hydratase